MRKALLIIGLAGLACGSQETGTSPDAGTTGADTPAVSAVQPPSEESMPAGDPVEVTTCVALVDEGKYAEGVVACQTAVELYPDSTKAAAALAKAGGANMAEGAGAAAGSAAGNAADAVKDAAKATGDAIEDAAGTRTNEAAKDAAEDAEDAVQ
jgi:hypothetical protein